MSLTDLLELSRALGDPSADCVILGEGNTSASRDEGSFWVKASGRQLHGIQEDGFVICDRARLAASLDGPDLDDLQTRALLQAALLPGSPAGQPSTEAFMHAYLLGLPGVSVVAHTHPTPLLSLLCLQDAESRAGQRLFPDEVVCCGHATCWVPYADPGLALARAIRASVVAFVDAHGAVPKTIWIQNHGLICLGGTCHEALTATRMSVKAARIWLGALQAGARMTTMTDEQIARIHTRPDEHYRQRLLWQIRSGAATHAEQA